MKTGDLVRFKRLGTSPRPDSEEWRIGLLLEYHSWEKVGTVLYESNIYRVRAENIQKAGKKDADRAKQ
mgnify:FL=1